MLAVREPYRNLDLGHKLKLAQRERALAMRVPEMTWTFDPLQSRNAHLNFGKLGVVSDIYKIDFYGPVTSSVLHQNAHRSLVGEVAAGQPSRPRSPAG